jgi:outer membrane protein
LILTSQPPAWRVADRMKKASLFALVTAASLSFAGMARASNLADAIALAYRTNPALLASRAELRALDERYIQSRDALGPTASASVQHSVDTAQIDQPGTSFTPPSTVHERATNTTLQLGVSQPLFSNGQISTAIIAAAADVQVGRQTLRQQETTVISQVVTAYADVLLAENLVRIAQQDIFILGQQVDETDAKVKLMAQTLTDRAQARSRLIASQLRLAQLRSSLTGARARYRAVVGEEPGALDPLPDLPGLAPTLQGALDAAARGNPQLLGTVYTEVASRARIAQAKATDGVQVGLSLNLNHQPIAPYLKDQEARSVIFSVGVSRPLFTSGLHQSKVRQAQEINSRDALKASDGRRQVASVIVQQWEDLAARRQILLGLKAQLAEEQIAFEGTRLEQRIGLRTTLDVLNAEQEYQSIKTSLAQTYHDEYLSRVGLVATSGLLEVQFLLPDEPLYQPEKTLYERQFANRMMPWQGLVESLDALGAPRMPGQTRLGDVLAGPAPPVETPMPAAPRWSELEAYVAAVPAPNAKPNAAP